MRYRNPQEDSDFFSMIDHQQPVIKSVKGINMLYAVISWVVLQKYHGLSDEETVPRNIVTTTA